MMNANLCRSLFLWCLWMLACLSCVSSRSQHTPDGNEIPGRRLLQVQAAEYKCEPFFAKGIKDTEEILNRYGSQGWRLAGFLVKEGQTYGFCLYR